MRLAEGEGQKGGGLMDEVGLCRGPCEKAKLGLRLWHEARQECRGGGGMGRSTLVA